MKFPLNRKFNVYVTTSTILFFVVLLLALLSPDELQQFAKFKITQKKFYQSVNISAWVSIGYLLITSCMYYGIIYWSKSNYFKKTDK